MPCCAQPTHSYDAHVLAPPARNSLSHATSQMTGCNVLLTLTARPVVWPHHTMGAPCSCLRLCTSLVAMQTKQAIRDARRSKANIVQALLWLAMLLHSARAWQLPDLTNVFGTRDATPGHTSDGGQPEPLSEAASMAAACAAKGNSASAQVTEMAGDKADDLCAAQPNASSVARGAGDSSGTKGDSSCCCRCASRCAPVRMHLHMLNSGEPIMAGLTCALASTMHMHAAAPNCTWVHCCARRSF